MPCLLKRHATDLVPYYPWFNMREQEEGEPIDVFITDLYTLAEHCSYGELHDEMIRDRIVVGIRSAKLSEKLQLDPKLTLETAVTQARQAEAVKLQQAVIRGEGAEYDTLPVGTLSEVRPHRPRRQQSRKGQGYTQDSPRPTTFSFLP